MNKLTATPVSDEQSLESVELEHAQEALRASEERYRTLFETIDEGFCVIQVLFDESGRPNDYLFLETNPAFAHQTGLRETIGKSVRQLLPAHEEHWYETYGRVAVTGEPIRFQNRADALQRWYDVYAFRIGEPRERKVAVLFSDITERKRTDEALRRSERELADFFENAVFALHWAGPDGIILRVNQAELDLLGYTRDEYVGRHIAEFHADREVIDDILRRLAAGEAVHGVAARLRCKDGSIKDVVIDSSVLWEDGRFIHTRCFTRDVTDQKQAEKAGALLSAIVDSSDDAIISKDLNGIITSWNRSAEQLFGYLPSEIIGRSVTMLIPADRQHEEPEILDRLKRGERVDHFDTIRVRKDGTPIAIALTISPVQDGSGRIIGASKIARDITERKLIDEALSHQQRQLQLVSDSVPSLISYVDPEYRYRFCNRAYNQWFGLPHEEIVGRQMEEILGPEAWTAVKPHLDAALAGRPAEFETNARYARGGARWIHAVYNPDRDADGQIRGVVVMVSDVGAAKAAEQALRDADRRKDEFLATLAHELRNPLAPVRNAVQILLAKGPADPLLERSRQTIDRQVKIMARLLDDLLDVSRISRNKLELRRQRIALRAVIEDALEISSPLVESGGHTLAVALPDEPVELDADAVRLAQVFANLLNNAAKYTDRGGRIALSAARVDGDVVISVKDTGIGISAQALPRVFEIFSQAQSALERAQGGLGIGLSLVKGVVELHGGSVFAHSDGPGKGSEFVVRLPVASSASTGPEGPDRTPSPAACEPPPAMSQCRILIADDNEDSADSLAMLLRIQGHDVAIAYDGLQAVAEAETMRPDVVLLDIGMPKLNGFDACRRIREQPWGRDVYLVALTGWGQDKDRSSSEEAGFDHHLVKPVDLDALGRLLTTACAAQAKRTSD